MQNMERYKERPMTSIEIKDLSSLIANEDKSAIKYFSIAKIMFILGIAMMIFYALLWTNLISIPQLLSGTCFFSWGGLGLLLFSILPFLIAYVSRGSVKEYKTDLQNNKVIMYSGPIKKRSEYVSSRYGGTTYYYIMAEGEGAHEFSVEKEFWNKIKDEEQHSFEFLPESKMILAFDQETITKDWDYRKMWVTLRNMKTRGLKTDEIQIIQQAVTRKFTIGLIMLIIGIMVGLSAIIPFLLITGPGLTAVVYALIFAFLPVIGIFIAVPGWIIIEGARSYKKDINENLVFIYHGFLAKSKTKPYYVGFPWEGEDLFFKVKNDIWKVVNNNMESALHFLPNSKKMLILNGKYLVLN